VKGADSVASLGRLGDYGTSFLPTGHIEDVDVPGRGDPGGGDQGGGSTIGRECKAIYLVTLAGERENSLARRHIPQFDLIAFLGFLVAAESSHHFAVLGKRITIIDTVER